jgi:hypothetical protein
MSEKWEACQERTTVVANEVLGTEQPRGKKYGLMWNVKKLLQRRKKYITLLQRSRTRNSGPSLYLIS